MSGMTPEQLWHYEHSFLRPLYPEASDEEIAGKVRRLEEDARQRAERRPACQDWHSSNY